MRWGLVVVVAAVLAAGCAPTRQPAPETVTVTERAPVEPSQGSTAAFRDVDYLNRLDQAGITFPNRGEAVETGHLVCEYLRENPADFEWEAAELVAEATGRPDGEAVAVVSAAVAAYCPQDGD